MHKIHLIALSLALGLAHPGAAQTASTETTTIAAAARTLLEKLSAEQRKQAVFDFKDDAQRKRWSNLPTGIFQRQGLRMGDLTPAQRDAVHALLAAALSPQGYEKVMQIVEGDEVLKQSGSQGPGRRDDRGPGSPGSPGERAGSGRPGGRGGPGGGLIFGRDEFYVSFLGHPSTTEPWMIQFGGHHLAINLTLVGDRGTLAPSLPAAQPAIYELEGKTVRPLGREVDKAFALLSSLDEMQRKQAVLGFEIRDLVLGPGRDGQTIQPEGIKGSALTEKQREMLLDLAGEWTGIQHQSQAMAKMSEMKQSMGETWFAWSGSTEKGGAAYFRIQGPTVHIEFAPQRMGGDPNKHIHTIYRDPRNDYGAKWWKR